MAPKVSVVMAVHDGGPYLVPAIDSILGQSFADLELIVIDDGSTDGSREALRALDDPRLKLLCNDDNRGLSVSLNRGLDAARGVYVARMDADDVSLPTRLARQVERMEGDGEIGICGAWVETFGVAPDQIWKYPSADAGIRCALLFHSALVHGSVMMRRAHLEEHGLRYDPAYRRAQDYDLWTRAAAHTALANVPEVLLRYRLHPQQAGQRAQSEQRAAARRVRRRQLAALGVGASEAELELHDSLARAELAVSRESLAGAERWLGRLERANELTRLYPEPAFTRELGRRWLAACRACRGLGMWAYRRFAASPLSASVALSRFERARFAAVSLWRGGVMGREGR